MLFVSDYNSKFSKADEKNIETDYQISINPKKNGIDEFELIEMVGILYDNAVEALESASQKKVNVNISEDNGMINISVDNVSLFISSEEMMTFFHRGVSTKGKNRGIGLAKLQKTAEKYDGKMNILIREYKSSDAEYASEIWNQVVEDGVAFPQEEKLTVQSGDEFFREQTYTGIAENTDTNEILGLYILHPNNVGRCGHICNASYAVRRDIRGEHIGEKLVRDCLIQAKEKGFRIMQFNAVVASNVHALHLYERIGFMKLGVIPGGFRMPDGHYEDIIPHYYVLA